MYILGIDGGGTKTTGAIVTSSGEVNAVVTVGPTNINSVGIDGVEKEIHGLIVKLKELNPHSFGKVSVLFAGMAGAGNEKNRDLLKATLNKVIDREIPCFVENDAIIALYSGSLGQEGVVHISGTGSIAYGINSEGERARVGGWGYLLGDPGSGFAIGKETLTRFFTGYDKGSRRSFLDEKLLQHFSINEPTELIPIIYGDSDSRRLIAAITPLVIAAADEGDGVAKNILHITAKDIAKNIGYLLPKLFSLNEEKKVKVVLTGGLFERKDWFVPMITEHLESKQMNVEIIVPSLPPVIGAVVGGLQKYNREIDSDFMLRVNSSFLSKEWI